jgi:multiple sugar transport system ATP-binding protein
MRIELARLHDELKATMIYVTHDQVEAMTMADKIVVLQAGIVEQAGSPLELYHHPRNIFVAGFIGSPKMNFLPGKVTAVDSASATVQLAGGSSITVPCQPGGLKAGASVTLGVRPEHLRPAEAGEIAGEAMVVERLGGETFIYTQIGASEMLVIQADGEIPTRVHEKIMVKLDPLTCHLFDSAGLAVGRAERHPLADVRRTSGRKAS